MPPASAAVLGLETSCDETAAAIVTAENRLVANVIASQVAVHREYGGVVPELASRHHLRNIVPVLQQTLDEGGVDLGDLAGIAVTRGPGLVGALLVGVQFAKSLAMVHGLRLVGVNHLEAHLDAVFLSGSAPAYPHLFLLVSGGHTLLGRRDGPDRFEVAGATRDDAAGEAFDKVAKMLGLGYPGGRVIDDLARGGDPGAIAFPRAMLHQATWDMSFSGLKTAVRTHLQRKGHPASQTELGDLCASFQEAVVDVLVDRACGLARATGLHRLVIAGGVAANSRLRARFDAAAVAEGLELFIPPPILCTDNAAMIAVAGHRGLAAGAVADLTLNASATWAPGRAR